METDLRHALDREELCLYYQPMFTADDNRQTAYEALSRWPHPSLGFVPPPVHPLGEETGLIVRLGSGCCAKLAANAVGGRIMEAQGSCRGECFPAAVRPRGLCRYGFPGTARNGLSGDLLDLEVTESIVLGDIDGTIRQMARLRELRRPNLCGRLWHRLLFVRLSS